MDSEAALSQIRVLARELASQIPALNAVAEQIRDVSSRMVYVARLIDPEHPDRRTIDNLIHDIDQGVMSPASLKIASLLLQHAGDTWTPEVVQAFRNELAGILPLMRS